MGSKRSMGVAVVYDNDLWVFGGFDGERCLDTAEVTIAYSRHLYKMALLCHCHKQTAPLQWQAVTDVVVSLPNQTHEIDTAITHCYCQATPALMLLA